jgi:hypothetical protein
MGGHNKGSSFERAIAKQLSLWWSKGVNDDIFWRTAGSGGRATVRGRKGQASVQVGDLCAIDPQGEPFNRQVVIELKRGYGKFDLLDLLDSRGKKPKLTQFLEQLEREMDQSGRVCSWLIFQRDFHRPMVIVNHAFLTLYVDRAWLVREKIPYFLITREERPPSWGVFRLDDLLKGVQPDAFNC